MVETLVLHVGPHKTGTTALQRAFAANAARLAHRGILYPVSGRSADCHAPLAEALRTGDTGPLDALAAEARGWRAVLLSSENLSASGSEALQALRIAFPQAEVRVSYTLRRLAALWPAHWAELVKHGQSLSFEDYMDLAARADETAPRAPVLPLQQLTRLTAVFGPGSLRIAIHDARTAQAQDIGPAFMDEMFGLGQDAPHFATDRCNPTPPGWETALVRLMNLHVAGRSDHLARRRMRLALLAALRDDPPGWLRGFTAATEQAPRSVLSSSHPLVQHQQSAVVAGFGHGFLDPAETYLAPIETAVFRSELQDLAPGMRIEVTALLDRIERSVTC
ncbi:MAG: hypothetical protein IPL38_00390 [Rhodobacter sp.]|nr:hypothetical protein [Rhodobacter sp.]